ncbi:hypothetical protein E0493_14955 [Roseomonas sp. M0104]|uniref:Uncharacterized protein n=1 Tax=Teichococcus coralli TaxID=2545983 RepID=A0A845BEW9_9PROT|nr:hypothetical protein [Pseudoroseomonas coralli]MXP64650.1 hypothetical protein [Pseudoroseomonas coralli]
MRLDDFARLLDTHGAEPARWPPEAIPAARALLERSATARGLQAEARMLDAALRDSLPGPSPEALARMRAHVGRAVARMPVPPQAGRGGVLQWLRPWLPAGCGALVTLAACGFWLSRMPQPAPEEVLGAPRMLAMMETAE